MSGMASEQSANWAGNVHYGARRVHRPTSVPELQAIVRDAEQVRPIGTGHSFSRIGLAAGQPHAGDLVSLAGLPPVVDIDSDAQTVTVGGSVRYGDLATRLHAAGFALSAMASVPHISVAGAVATGTHGSGDRSGGLATAVAAIELVTSNGDRVTLRRDGDAASSDDPDAAGAGDGDACAGAIVGLGALGVVTHLTLRVEPTFDMAQWVYEGLGWQRLTADFDQVFASAHSVSVFTRWTPRSVDYVWRKVRLDASDVAPAPKRWLDATLADGPRHPIPGMSPDACTPQLGAPGPWYERLPHFRLEATPSAGAELQSEYLVPREHAVAAITAIHAIGPRIAPVLLVSELRTVAADELWLSPSYGRDSLAIHFTWRDDMSGVLAVLPLIESALEPFEPRPHWGKVFAVAPEIVAGRYPRHADFGRLRARLDPRSVFGNEFVDRYVPAISGGVPQYPTR